MVVTPRLLATEPRALISSRKGPTETRVGAPWRRLQTLHSLSPSDLRQVERLYQTLKRFLRKQSPAGSVAELQFQLEAFRDYYNNRRHTEHSIGRHRSAVFNTLLKAKPTMPPAPVDHRVRHHKIDAFGKVTLRYLGRLRHIPVGRAHKNCKVRLLVAGLDVRIVAEDGQLIHALTLDPHATTSHSADAGQRMSCHRRELCPEGGQRVDRRGFEPLTS